MLQYNLLNNSLIESSTVSGTGNVSLTVDEVRLLYDGNTTSSGISLSITDVLCLNIDMYNRVSVKDFKLYINPTVSGGALTKVNFYYKNNESEDYTLCSKGESGYTFFPVGLPELFAPRYIKTVISELECEVFELEITNDDTQVAFGSDGNRTMKVLDHGYEGYDTLEIFNNAPLYTPPVNAYIIVDYKGNDSDSYIKLSNSSEGNFIGINDDYLITDNDFSSKYYWAQGRMDGVDVYQDNLILSLSRPSSEGYYTTPVIGLNDKFTYTYLITKQIQTVDELNNTYSVTWQEDPSNIQTVKVRSSNTAPKPFNRFFIFYMDDPNHLFVYEGDLDTGQEYIKQLDDSYTSSNPKEIIFDKQRTQYVVLVNNDRFRKYKYFIPEAGDVLYSSSGGMNMQGKWGLDYFGNIWGQNTYGGNYKLQFISSDLNNVTTLVDNGGIELVFDLSVHPTHSSCWYSDYSSKTVNHIDAEGTDLAIVGLNNPTYICSLNDGGCLVVDSDEHSIKRLDYYGELLNEVSYSSNYNIIDISYGISMEETTSIHERFWVLTSGGHILYFDFNGNILADNKIMASDSICAFTKGCLVFNRSSKFAYQLNENAEISRTWNFDSLNSIGTNLFTIEVDYQEYLNLTEAEAILPAHNDPVWGDDHNDGWREVNNDGYLLPMNKFHQFKYKLNGYVLDVPIVNPGAEDGTNGWTPGTSGYYSYFYTTTSYSHSGNASFCTGGYTRHYSMSGSQYISLTTVSGIDLNIIDNCHSIYENGYILSLSAYFRHISFGIGELRFKLYDGNDSPIVPNVWVTSGNLYNNYWNKIVVHKKLLSGTRNVKIEMLVHDEGYDNYSCWDDFELYLVRSAGLESIKIPTPTKIPDIEPQQSKSLYIKTEIPPEADNIEYENKLRCWWGNQKD